MSDRCSICLDELHRDIGVAIPCGHCFHRCCFESLRTDCSSRLEDGEDGTRDRAMPHCPCCKKRIRKFYDLFLTFDQGDQSGCKSVCTDATKAVAVLTGEKIRLTKRLREMKSLSKDQSELLFRILPQYDEMESKYKLKKKENARLVKKLRKLEGEKEEARAKKKRVERRLKESEEENLDLHFIWDELDAQLSRAKRKKKKVKNALKDQEQELVAAKENMYLAMKEKKKLKVSLEASVSESAQWRNETLKLQKRAKRAKKKAGKAAEN